MAKGNKKNQFKIKETYLEKGVKLEEVRASMTDWFGEVLALAKKLELEDCQKEKTSVIIDA